MSERPQIALFGEQVGGLPPGVDWLVCAQQADGVYAFLRGEQHVATVDFRRPLLELPDLVAIFGLSDDPAWPGLTASWQAAFAAARVALERVAAEPGAILHRALHHLAAACAAQRAYAGRMALDLAAYRQQFETMQTGFAALEAHVAAACPAPVREAFHLPASGASADLGEAGRLTQTLPVNSLGVGGIWMSLTGTQAAPLRVTLRAIETGAVLASWRVTPQAAQPGWTHLALERAVSEAALTLELAIEGGAGWLAGLGPPNPFEEFCAKTPAGALAAPLALRVGTVLPGTRPPVSTLSIRAEEADARETCLLPEADFASLTEIFLRPGDEAMVLHDREFAFVQVHTRGQGAIAAARLSVQIPQNAWCVSALIHLAHEEAQPAWFGLLAAPPCPAEAEVALLTGAVDGTAGFSGWFELAALERRTIATVLPRAGGRLCLYLLTRQDDAPTFAWARFNRLAWHFLPGAPAAAARQLEMA